ncbi:hypothetical protein FACS1894120_6990 [Clostridia bacterium]|nr:hypothetical protein FACS1894120_6990 [Clostridia bacterium]
MFSDIFKLALESLMLFALHFDRNGTFPAKLSKEKELEYFGIMNTDTDGKAKEARDRLIMHNMRLVAYIVRKKYKDSKEPAEDLISIGSIGLVKAVSAYDTTKKTPFGTYAAICIDNEIKMYFRKNNKTFTEVPLDDKCGEDGGTLLDKLAADDDPLMDVISLLGRRGVYNAINKYLDTRERKVIARRYGLNFEG